MRVWKRKIDLEIHCSQNFRSNFLFCRYGPFRPIFSIKILADANVPTMPLPIELEKSSMAVESQLHNNLFYESVGKLGSNKS